MKKTTGKKEPGNMTLKEAEEILLGIYGKEGKPIIIITGIGGYRGEGVVYSMDIGIGRIKTKLYSSLEELFGEIKKKYC